MPNTIRRVLRVFISSPGDVNEERELAKQVIQSLRRTHATTFDLVPIFWEDLPLSATSSFQAGIDSDLSDDSGIDIAIFILWSRMGSPLGPTILKEDKTPYLSGTEREWDIMSRAAKDSESQGQRRRPEILVYVRKDDVSFHERTRGLNTAQLKEAIDQKSLIEEFINKEFRDSSGANKGATFSYNRPGKFSDLLRTHLSALLEQLADRHDATPIWDIHIKGSPFRGLESFEPEDTDVFFGREKETLKARHILREKAKRGTAFILLSGASGSGKSSLARAGVIPAIRTSELDDQVSEWRPIILTPSELGEDLVAGLMRRLTIALPEALDANNSADSLVNGMNENPSLTVELRINEAFAKASQKRGGGVRVILLLDQLEELFAKGAGHSEAQQKFFSTLEALVRCGNFWAIATVRSDFSPQVQAEPSLVKLLEDGGLLPVLPPEADALRRLIEEPAKMAGLVFEKQEAQSLADRILADAYSHAELLPQLEYVLSQLYNQRVNDRVLAIEVYERLGGVEGALVTQAELVFGKISPAARESLGAVLKALVSFGKESLETGEDQIVRQRVARPTLEAVATGAKELINAFVDDAHLFISSQGMITIAHESLLRLWPRAAAWVDENRDFLRIRARISSRLEEGSPLLDGDPLLEAARYHLDKDFTGFNADQRIFIEDSLRKVADERRKREWKRYGLIGGVAALIIAATAFYFMTERRTQQQKERDAMGRQLVSVAERELSRKDYAKAEVAAARALAYSDSSETRTLLMAARSGGVRHVAESDDVIPQAGLSVFSRDGEVVASAVSQSGRVLIEVCKGGQKKWSMPGGKPGEFPESMAFSSDNAGGRYLAIANQDHSVVVWELPEQGAATLYRELKSPGDGHGAHTKRVPSMAFHPKHPWLATSGEDQKLCLWDLAQSPARLIWEQESAHDTAVHGIAFDSAGESLASGGGDYLVKIWPVSKMTEGYSTAPDAPMGFRAHPIEAPLKLKGHTDSVFAVAFSPDGQRLASAGYDRIVRIWDLSLRKEIPQDKQSETPGDPVPKFTHPTIGTLYGHEGTVMDLAFSDDSKLLTSGAKDETVRLWDVSEGRLLATFSPSHGVIRSVAGKGFDSNIYCGGESGWAAWSAAGRTSSARLWNGGATVQAIAFDPGGEFLAAGGNDGKVRLWDKNYRSQILDCHLASESINAIAFNSDGTMLAAGGEGRVVHVWRKAPDGWQKISPPSGSLAHNGPIWGLCFDPRGRWLISGNTDENKRIRKWDTATWKLIEESPKLDHSVYTLGCVPDGTLLVRGDSAGRVEVWRLDPLGLLKDSVNVSQGEANVWSVAICPEPLSVFSGNSDGRVYRWVPGLVGWNSGAAEQKASISTEDAALNHTINSVSYSPKHQWVAAGGDGGSVQIYDFNLKLVRSLLPTDGSIWFVAFDPAGSRLAYGGTDRILRIVDIDQMKASESEAPAQLFEESKQFTGMSIVDGRVTRSIKGGERGSP